MRRQQFITEAEGSKVPAYIVTFSDMVTLLLTFFVMLMTLAQVQDPELFHIGRDSFIKSMQNFGLGMLLGKKMALDFGGYKMKYFISSPDELLEVRSIDARGENVRRLFKEVSRSMTTMPSQIVAKQTNFSVADISFSAGGASLNEPAKKFLTRFSQDLQANDNLKRGKLYVLGLAKDAKGEQEQWILSAKRAQAVSDFLRSILPTPTLASQEAVGVYSWGAGPGGQWVSENSPVSGQSQILIAVLRAND